MVGLIGSLIVLAKEPRPGFSKTRLCPPLNPEEACVLAAAALEDTLAAVLSVPADRHILCLEGARPPGLATRMEVIPQRGMELGERLAAAFEDTDGPSFLIAMDTPQVSPTLLRFALAKVVSEPAPVLGLTLDGGFWGIGFSEPLPGVFEGVPMSSAETGARQYDRLLALGAPPSMLPMLRDVDLFHDAQAVARDAPHLGFSDEVRRASVRAGHLAAS